MIPATGVRRAPTSVLALLFLTCVACDGGTSALFGKRYSIADQIADATNANTPFTPTPQPTSAERVLVSETATLSLTPMFTVGDGRSGHPLQFVGGVTQVLPLRNGRIVVNDQRDRKLHVLDSAGRLLSSQPASGVPPDLLTRVFGTPSFFADMVSRGDTLVALSRNYNRGAGHTVNLLVAGKPELTRALTDLDDNRTSVEPRLRGVSATLDAFVSENHWMSGARKLSQPQQTLWRVAPSDTADLTTRVLQYTRADSLLTVNDGKDAFRALFGSRVSIAFSDRLIYLARDTSPRIEVFSLDGTARRTIDLNAARVPITPEIFARKRDAIFSMYGSMDTALKTALAEHPYPAHQPIIRELVAAPDGHLLVLREDLGWDAPKDEQRLVFDVFDASFRHIGRGRLARDEWIKLFNPPLLCTTHFQPDAPESSRGKLENGETPPTRGLVTCYRIGESGAATP